MYIIKLWQNGLTFYSYFKISILLVNNHSFLRALKLMEFVMQLFYFYFLLTIAIIRSLYALNILFTCHYWPISLPSESSTDHLYTPAASRCSSLLQENLLSTNTLHVIKYQSSQMSIKEILIILITDVSNKK